LFYIDLFRRNFFDYSVSGKDIKNLFAESLSNIEPVFGLTDENSKVIKAATQIHSVTSDQISEVRKQISVGLTGLADLKNVKARINLNGLKAIEGVFASLGHIQDYTSLADKHQKQVEEREELVRVDEYNIQNYPNPFNPTTNIAR